MAVSGSRFPGSKGTSSSRSVILTARDVVSTHCDARAAGILQDHRSRAVVPGIIIRIAETFLTTVEKVVPEYCSCTPPMHAPDDRPVCHRT